MTSADSFAGSDSFAKSDTFVSADSCVSIIAALEFADGAAFDVAFTPVSEACSTRVNASTIAAIRPPGLEARGLVASEALPPLEVGPGSAGL